MVGTSSSSSSPVKNNNNNNQQSYENLKNSYEMAWKMMDAAVKDAEKCKEKMKELEVLANDASQSRDLAVNELAATISEKAKTVINNLTSLVGNNNNSKNNNNSNNSMNQEMVSDLKQISKDLCIV